MNIKKSILLAATTVLLTASSYADSLGGFVGTMNTKNLGTGSAVGAIFRLDIAPLVSLELRGAYVDEFDAIGNMETALSELHLGDLKLDDFCVVPLEIGPVVQISVLDMLGFYVGGGYGYYYIPAFDLMSENGYSAEESSGSVNGWWAVAGVEAGLPNISLFAEVKYTHIVDTLETNFEFGGYGFNVHTDLDLSGLSALVGIRLKW